MSETEDLPTWHTVIDHECSMIHLECDATKKRDTINKLICWHVSAALDPVISDDAYALLNTVPECVDQALNGVMTNLEMIAAGCDLVTGEALTTENIQNLARQCQSMITAAWAEAAANAAGNTNANEPDFPA